ncbi:uncharacterized protein RCC_06243 [Ramularia collo-cygni]|uniref:Uncharacterized protein n=1 Tax=Ramularia collo-cygni TaxID=112498 RepID=A0A2D3VHY6_9PEZI|nr:uncharacterized protein RCC_06243 [Ramularia collo-cygni]CZT20383.1 uncharacterized protein RCC_06243 [Ramularia collo-cygni]
MSLLNILRLRASCRTITTSKPPTSLTSLTSTPPRHGIIPTLPARWRSPLHPTSSSTRRLASSNAATAARTPLIFPSHINIYRAGTPITLFTGFLRISTIIIFAAGTLGVAPTYFFSPDHSSLWVPFLIIGSAIPLALITFMTGPVVHAIHMRLPTPARKSKAELRRFAEAVPGDTVLQLYYMRLAPWCTSKEVRMNRLRRLTPSIKGGIANLEYVPEHAEKHAGSIWFWLVQGYWGRYYVKRDQRRDRAQVAGVLDKMWEGIPWKGSPGDPLVRGASKGEERRVVRMSGRPGVMSGREEVRRKEVVLPPPPPPGSKQR